MIVAIKLIELTPIEFGTLCVSRARSCIICRLSVSLIFGAITCVGGILGVVIGSGAAQWYRKRNPRADPLICGLGVLLSVPFAFIGIVVPHKSPATSWLTIFIAITFLCINWTLSADILLYVITPTRRSFAQAMQILVAHLLGDAASPYVVGMVSGDDA